MLSLKRRRDWGPPMTYPKDVLDFVVAHEPPSS